MNAYFTLFLNNSDKTKREIFTTKRPINKDSMYETAAVFEILDKNVNYNFNKETLNAAENFLLAINKTIPITEIIIEKIIVSQVDYEELDLENKDTYQTYNSMFDLFDFYTMIECN